MERMLPSERIRKEIAEIVGEGVSGNGSVISAWVHRASEVVPLELLGAEVTEVLERRRVGKFKGYRNGHEPVRIRHPRAGSPW